MRGLRRGWLASLPEPAKDTLAAALSPAEARALLYDWPFWARPAQLPPPGNWRVWLLLAGRGFGKTRTGAELIRARVAASTARRLALVASPRRRAQRDGRGRKRHPGDLAALGPASLRAVEATIDVAERGHRNAL